MSRRRVRAGTRRARSGHEAAVVLGVRCPPHVSGHASPSPVSTAGTIRVRISRTAGSSPARSAVSWHVSAGSVAVEADRDTRHVREVAETPAVRHAAVRTGRSGSPNGQPVPSSPPTRGSRYWRSAGRPLWTPWHGRPAGRTGRPAAGPSRYAGARTNTSDVSNRAHSKPVRDLAEHAWVRSRCRHEVGLLEVTRHRRDNVDGHRARHACAREARVLADATRTPGRPPPRVSSWPA